MSIRVQNLSRDVLMIVGSPVALAKPIILDPAPVAGMPPRLGPDGKPLADRSFAILDDETAKLCEDEIEKFAAPIKGKPRVSVAA